jgi:hypothetical protein
VEEKKTRLEEASKLLLVKQSEVEKLRKEVERKHKAHADFKKEMLMAVNKTREEIKIVKEKREKRDSERDKKRQVIVKYIKSIVTLNECMFWLIRLSTAISPCMLKTCQPCI